MRDITLEEFDELMNNGSKILIFFCGDDCIRCRTLEPELERVEGQMNVPLYKSNAQSNPDLANKLGVFSIPYLILIENNIKLNEYNDVNTGDFILDYFGIRIPEHHDHDQEPEIVKKDEE